MTSVGLYKLIYSIDNPQNGKVRLNRSSKKTPHWLPVAWQGCSKP